VKLRTARPVAKLRQGRNDWYRIVRNQAGGGSTAIYIYDEIGYFGVTAQDFVRDLQAVDTPRIDLHISSPGGDVFDGLAIYESLRTHSAEVTTHVDSLAASIASVIAMAGDARMIAPAGTMMIHDGHGVTIGNAADMREMADLLDKTSNTIAGVYAARAGGDLVAWRDAMRAESWYSAAEAVQAGLATEVAGDAADAPAAAASFDLSIYDYAGREQAPAPVIQPEADEFDVVSIAKALEGAFA
jgi:ATP-dependent protease ClpP protease subunit